MLNYLNNMTTQRLPWLVLAAIAIVFEVIALYFQYGMGLGPCVMCIYQRTAILGIAIAGLIGSIAPQYFIIRLAGFSIWGYSTIKGLLIALEHVDIQINPSPFFSCAFRPDFPSWLPLDEMLPFFFRVDGDCAAITWQWLGWSMSQWMVVIFSGFTIALTVVVLNRLRPSNQFLI
ncbi:disulfide bond formation protein DsbB [Psychrobium sp. 1_MG-2023]|uniref:disulfide bond formation protein DsbB n=1 Tax=Psychrobium sp. 1_MG-2023 TaxID=3062624 RepID=UPI000C31C886|nr:disulfide bond formation protein DsbB [Psychrobium sp. 1_MG-2023]MDP2562202.1 disulfide bond formation protein DsbB [Psychrobium sp. 1_MG-2023]PKF58095.1 disulfide bond formation protein DsbB [Alteromonadales bacterium alter-6D02]